MSDEAAVAQPTAQDAPAQDAPTPTEPAPTPPWGSDEDFNLKRRGNSLRICGPRAKTRNRR